jgi:RNase adapter protein RapZ
MGDIEQGELVVVTGMTGAGRSTAAKELEDLGYYVVDNLPPELVASVVRLVDEKQGPGQPVAAVVDVRAGVFFDSLREQLATELDSRRTTLLYLEASDDILVRRQEAARRPHPLQGSGRLLEAIHREREVMGSLRGDADLVIDTTPLNVHQLKAQVAHLFGTPDTVRLRISVVSFGFKYGVPVDADLLADMRFLPNPFWIPELKALTGLDPEVSDYVMGGEGAREFVAAYAKALSPVLAGYQRENKRHATIAIGCTGGKHRSVAVGEKLASLLRAEPGVVVNVKHRDLGRE